jgi:hypothetical protein
LLVIDRNQNMGDGNFYPALLPVGFHTVDTLEIRQLCVDDARLRTPE